MLRSNILRGLIVLVLSGISLPLLSIELKTAAQNSHPKYFILENNKMGGICVDIMQAIERVDPEIKFNGYQEFLPFKRLQISLEEGGLDVFFGFRKTEERKINYLFLDVPLYQINYVVAVRADDKVKINSFDDIRSLYNNGSMLTVFGTAASDFLKMQEGVLVDDGAKNTKNLLEMLVTKRGRFAFYHDIGLRSAIKYEGYSTRIKILPVSFLTYSHFAVFSSKVPSETIDKVRSAIKKLQSNGELVQIISKYNLQE